MVIPASKSCAGYYHMLQTGPKDVWFYDTHEWDQK